MKKLLILVAIVLLPAFVLFAAEPQTTNTDEEVPVNYEIIQKGTYSGLTEAMTRVIETQKDWEDVWKKHIGILVPQPPVPEIDFTTNVIAVIALGEKKTSGYQIVLKDVAFAGNDVEVTYKTTEPPEHSFTLQVLSQPYLMLRIEKPAAGTVKFVTE